MASIPLPALSLKTPEQPNTMQLLGQASQLSAMRQEQQANALKLQEGQQDLQDQQAFRQAMTDPNMKGKTLGEIADSLASSGHISMKAYQGAKTADLSTRKSLAEVDEKTLANRKASHDQTQQLYNNAQNMPDDQLAQNWASIAQQYDSIPGNQPLLDPNKPMTKAQLASFGPMLDMHDAYLNNELAKRKTAAEAAQAESKGALNTVEAQTKQRADAATTLANAPDRDTYTKTLYSLPMGIARSFPDPTKFNAQDPNFRKSVMEAGMTPDQIATTEQGAQRVNIADREANISAGRLNLETKKFNLDQSAIEDAAQTLAKGDVNDLTRLRDIASMRGDQRILLYNRAKQINPNFSTSAIDRKIKMMDEFTTGTDGKNLQSFGTFLEHAGAASDATNAFRATGSPLINKPLRELRGKYAGDPAVTDYLGSLEPVRKEFEGFLLGGRALYGDDRKAAEVILSDDASPAQQQAALKRMGHTVQARYNEADHRFKNTVGKSIAEAVGPLSSEALAGAQKIGIDMGGTVANPHEDIGFVPAKQ